jgi:hypothetical protein
MFGFGWGTLESVYRTTVNDFKLFVVRNTIKKDEKKVVDMRKYIREEDLIKAIESIKDGPELNETSIKQGLSEPRLVYAFQIGRFELLRKLLDVADNSELQDLACFVGTRPGGKEFVEKVLLKLGRFKIDSLRNMYMYPINMDSIFQNKDIIRIFSDNGADLSFLYIRCGNPSYMKIVMDMGGSIHSKVFRVSLKKEDELLSLSQMIGLKPSIELNKSISQKMSGFQSEKWDDYLHIMRREFWMLLYGSVLYPYKIKINSNTEFDKTVNQVSCLSPELIHYIGSFLVRS